MFSSHIALEGAIVFMLDRSYLELSDNSEIKISIAYNRGMIVALAGSWFNISSTYLDLNTAYADTVFAYLSEGRDIMVFSDKVLT